MEFNDYIKQVKKVSSKRNHKIINSLGIKDAYYYYRKNRPKEKKFVIDEKTHAIIIRRINELVADKISKGYEIRFPYKMGGILIESFEISPKINNEGKLVFNAPIDWDSTLKLWYESEEDRKNKTLIKTEKRNIYKIIYNKKNINYKNKGYVTFSATRELKQKIKKESAQGYIQKKF